MSDSFRKYTNTLSGIRSWCLMLVFCSIFNNALGQDEKIYAMIDSLQSIVDTSEGTANVDASLVLYGYQVQFGDAKHRSQSYQLLQKCLELSRELKYGEGMYTSYSAFCNIYINSGDYQKALEYYKMALPFSSQIRPEFQRRHLGGQYKRLSRIYSGMGMLDSALYYYKKSLESYDEIEDCGSYASTYVYLANLYILMGDIHAEIQARMEAYNNMIDCETDNKEVVIGVAASSLGYSLMTCGNYNEALKYFRIADSLIVNGVSFSKRYKNYFAQQPAHIARVYQLMGELDSALHYRQLALKRFREFGFPETTIDVPNQYCYIGTIYREMGDFKVAREYFNKSLNLRISNGDSLGVGMCLDEMAEMARLEGQYYDAVSMLNEALIWKSDLRGGRIAGFRKAQEVESLSETYLNLGKVFADWRKYEDALMYYDTSYSMCKQVNLNRGRVLVDFFRGQAWQNSDGPDSALFYLQRAEQLADSLMNRPLKAKVLFGLGSLQIELGLMQEGRSKLNDALDIYLEDGFRRELPAVYLELGKAIYQDGEQESAISHLTTAFDEADEMGLLRIKGEAARRLAMLLEAKGDLKQANFYLRQYSATRDSIFTLESHKQLAEMQALHESQRQQLEIERLEQDNEINAMRYDRSRYAVISLGGMMVIIILFAILLIRQNSIRNQQRVLENQQKLFRSQMNPHFIFNSLTNIQHYIFSKDSYTAGKYLAIFAKLMRNILNNSRQERITLRNEVETIQQYLDLQKLRMDEKLEYSLEVDEDLDQEIVEIPPMLAQPFIENAIEHGLRNKEGAGILSIRIMKNGKSLIYEIEDNGVGRKKAAEYMEKRHRDHQSMAVSLTRSRLQSLWGRKKVKALKIIDLMDAEGNARGTRVLLKVPGF